jgi:mitogen-activated protein kinase kinase 1
MLLSLYGIQDELKCLETIGRGCSSYVQKAVHVPSGTPLAIKVINLYDKAKRDQLLQEINTLYFADCPSLIRFHGAFFKDSAISICLEYMDHGCLLDVVKRCGVIPENILAAVTFQILWGLAYLKYENRFHRDIKPANILVNSRGNVKLTDFGIAKEMENLQMAKTFMDTFKYMSPERMQSEPYNYKSDIWSLGIVLIECATGCYPYKERGVGLIEMVQNILEQAEPNVDPTCFSAEFREFLSHCMKKDAEQRLPADILLASPWLQNNGANDITNAVEIVRQWLISHK